MSHIDIFQNHFHSFDDVNGNICGRQDKRGNLERSSLDEFFYFRGATILKKKKCYVFLKS